MPFELCPVCGGDMIEKEVEKLILGGNNTAGMMRIIMMSMRRGSSMISGRLWVLGCMPETKSPRMRSGLGMVLRPVCNMRSKGKEVLDFNEVKI